MVIDFHTHTFPDKIAEKSISFLERKGGIKAVCSATRSALAGVMSGGGADVSVVLPVATSPKQEHTINLLSAEINGNDNIYYFGAVHPGCENVEETLTLLKLRDFAELSFIPITKVLILMTKGTLKSLPRRQSADFTLLHTPALTWLIPTMFTARRT